MNNDPKDDSSTFWNNHHLYESFRMLKASPTADILADVPPSVYQSPSYFTPRQRWRQSYNVAAWIRFKNPTQEKVRLILRIEDSSGMKDISIDKARVINAVVLLSSRVTLNLTGPIRSMKILLESPTPKLKVDELVVQAVKGSLNSTKAAEIEPVKAVQAYY